MNNRFLFGVTAVAGATLGAGVGLADELRDDDVPTIVVTADPRGDRTADEIIQPVSVLRGDELDLRRAGTLGEVLNGLPGVANSDFGPGVGRPVIRGLQGSRVQVLEDGLRAVDVSGEGADHAMGIDPSRAEQIEVLRGPATLLYGGSAAGGVINVRTERFDPGFGTGLRTRGALGYGENGNDRQGRIGIDVPLDERFVVRADGSVRRSGDFAIDGFQQVDQDAGNRNTLRNSSIETDAFSLTGLVRGERGYLGLSASRWDTDYGVPENFDARPVELGGQEDEFERVLAEYDRVDLRSELRDPLRGFTALRLKMAYTEFEQQEVGFLFERTPAGGELAEREVEAAFANDELEGRVELVHTPLGDWRGVFGLHFRDRDFFAGGADDDASFYVRPNRTRGGALFLLEERLTGFGRVEFGARVEHERSSPRDVLAAEVEGVTLADGSFLPLPGRLESRSFTPVSLSAGTIVDLPREHHLSASITRAERAPSPEQLYAFGRHAAAGTFEVGDPDLGKEVYNNLELGIDRHEGRLRYDVGLFYNRVDDFIFLQSEDDGSGSPVLVNDIGNRAGEGAAADCAPGDTDGLCRLRNQLVFSTRADAEFYGAEFSAIFDLVAAPVPVSLRFMADHVRGKLREGGNLPRITPTRVGVGLDTGWRNLDLRIDYRRVFTQDDAAEAEDPTDGFDLVSFDVLWYPDAFGGATLFFQGRNLLNEDGRVHQSFFRDEAPIIGRAFVAGIRFDFGS